MERQEEDEREREREREREKGQERITVLLSRHSDDIQ